MSYPVHPAAAVFPPIEGDEFTRLVESIKERGQDNPIVLTANGEVLDGRNRLRACEAAGVEPQFTRYGGSDPVDFVRRQNLRRRDLTPSQKAAIALELDLMSEQAKAKERQSLAGQSFGRGLAEKVSPRGDEAISAPDPNAGRATARIAEYAGVGRTTVERVKRVKDEDPEMFERIKSGEVSAKTAERAVAVKKVMPAPNGKTREAVIARENVVRDMASKGHSAAQIAASLEIGEPGVKEIAKRIGVTIHANAVIGRTRRIDPNRVVSETVSTLEGVAFSLGLLGDDLTDLDVEQVAYWVASLSDSIRPINRLIKALKEINP